MVPGDQCMPGMKCCGPPADQAVIDMICHDLSDNSPCNGSGKRRMPRYRWGGSSSSWTTSRAREACTRSAASSRTSSRPTCGVGEGKGKDAQMALEYARVYILTNEDEVVDLEDLRQRRWIVDGSLVGNEQYFRDLVEKLSTPEFKVNWFKFLMARDLSHYNRYSPNLPITDIMRRHFQTGRPLGASYIID
eukprot:47172-Eustigmatos_ZCMA.PRE.1